MGRHGAVSGWCDIGSSSIIVLLWGGIKAFTSRAERAFFLFHGIWAGMGPKLFFLTREGFFSRVSAMFFLWFFGFFFVCFCCFLGVFLCFLSFSFSSR